MRRDERIVLRISEGERGIVERAATRRGLPVSTFTRVCALEVALAVLDGSVGHALVLEDPMPEREPVCAP